MLGIEAAAVALNVAAVAPAVTVTVAGTVSKALLLASITVEPPVGAVCVNVTVQVLTVLCPKFAGLHTTPDTSTGARRLIVAARELDPSVAVTVALWLLGIEAAAVALNVAVVAPAVTATVAGTVSSALLLASVTDAPPVNAGCVVVSVQLLTALCPRLMGLQATPEIKTGGGANRLSVVDCELVPRVAVTVTV